MNRRYAHVSRLAGHRCEYCLAPEVIFNFPFEVERVIPTSAGGADDDENLCLACRSCNVHKGAGTSRWDETTAADHPLFHPRADRWAEHFDADLDTGEIRGTTPHGRVTVARLRMNDPIQLVARLTWICLRLFP